MHLKKNKIVFSLIIFTALLILIVSLFAFFWPRYEMKFFEVGLLGKDKMARDFFPDENSTISIFSPIDWHIYVHNHMGNNQDVTIRVKLIDSKSPLPNDREQKPLQSIPIIEYPLSLSIDETQFIPFFWTLLEVDVQGETTILKSIMVNDQIVVVDTPNYLDSTFRLVFELWIYNQSSKEYEFGWENGFGTSSSSLNITFSIT